MNLIFQIRSWGRSLGGLTDPIHPGPRKIVAEETRKLVPVRNQLPVSFGLALLAGIAFLRALRGASGLQRSLWRDTAGVRINDRDLPLFNSV